MSSINENKVYDTIILGGGPSGLSALLYAVRGGLSSVLLEDNPYGCGQISLTERVDNYPGLFGISGYDLGEKLQESAVSNGGKIQKAKVLKIEKKDDVFSIACDKDEAYYSKTIIIALGAHHRHLNIDGEEKFTGKGVSYCAVCDAAFFKGKQVAVIGGGDTALGDAITLSNFASKVYLVHRRSQFRASSFLQNRIKTISNIEPILDSVPLSIEGDKKVEMLKLNTKELKVDGVFVAIGEEPNSLVVKDFVKTDENGYIITDENMNTSVNGVFAAGDIRQKRLRQVVTAVADGAIAATSCIDTLNKK